jgi:hypothetical protein
VNRPGKDYKSIELPSADPALCRRACDGDAQCRAYTYVKPGVQGPSARCWLKSEVPPGMRDECCVSGGGSPAGGAEGTGYPGATTGSSASIRRARKFQRDERPQGAQIAGLPTRSASAPAWDSRLIQQVGEDYRDFAMPDPNPELCKAACQDDSSARIHLRPGRSIPRARALLVEEVAPNPCATSGAGQVSFTARG